MLLETIKKVAPMLLNSLKSIMPETAHNTRAPGTWGLLPWNIVFNINDNDVPVNKWLLFVA